MIESKRSRLSLLLVALLLIGMASSASAFRLSCSNVCTPTCPCEQACVDGTGASSTCGDEGFQCVVYFSGDDLTDEATFLESLESLETPDAPVKTPAQAETPLETPTAVPTAQNGE